ncbi:MAG: nuclear transport factor 2 family protein [Atopobiaceae bacterium]|nr:nuclear transport factor 2 family protein [Atopobiaceae bacterium]
MARIDATIEQEILATSEAYWQAQLTHDVEGLRKIADPLCPFVHMGITMDRGGEEEAIGGGMILTQTVDTKHLDVRVIDEDIAIVLRQLELTALVGGHEAINPFIATETYHRQADGSWKLISFVFTRIMPENYTYRFLSE